MVFVMAKMQATSTTTTSPTSRIFCTTGRKKRENKYNESQSILYERRYEQKMANDMVRLDILSLRAYEGCASNLYC